MTLAQVGLILGMLGVVLIFIWGPPQPDLEQGANLGLETNTRLPDGRTVAERDEDVRKLRKRHGFLSKVGLILVGFGFLCQLLAQFRPSRSGQITTLTSQLADRTVVNKLELQQKCADRARIAFKDLNLTARDSYKNHYNASLNKCFIEVEQIFVEPHVAIIVGLYDAFENKKYASFIVMGGKKEPTLCRVTQVNGEEQDCNSDAQYQRMIKTYMEGD